MVRDRPAACVRVDLPVLAMCADRIPPTGVGCYIHVGIKVEHILFVGGRLSGQMVRDTGEPFFNAKIPPPSATTDFKSEEVLPPISIERYRRRKIHMPDGPDIEFFAIDRLSDREALEYVFSGRMSAK